MAEIHARTPDRPGREHPGSSGQGAPSVSILYPDARSEPESPEPPECFRDLNLDRVVEAVTTGR